MSERPPRTAEVAEILQRKHASRSVRTPFSLKATALSHGWHECAPLNWSEGGSCLQSIERRKAEVFRVSITENRRTRDRVSLRVTVEGHKLDDDVMTDMVRRVETILSLRRDVREFHELCTAHPTLALVPKIGAGRMIRSASMTENIVKAICATNVNWTQAVKMINRIAQLGPSIRHFVNQNAWPTPREILRAGAPYLRDVCRLGYRVESILCFCDDVCEGRFDPSELDTMAASPDASSDDLLALLRSIKGVGPSSAHFLLTTLGRFDRISIDSATVAHVARTHTHGKKPTNRRIEAIYQRYGKWRNLVWWYENWLTWATAKRIIHDAGLKGPAG